VIAKQQLTRSFRATLKARIAYDAEFRKALSHEGIECLLSDDKDKP
jgi:hypothetical protein